MEAELILPRPEFEPSYLAYIHELGGEERYPFPLDFDHSDFAALIKRLENFAGGIDLPQGYVPSTTYWLVEGSELIGVSSLRHFLNDRLSYHGGHIGLGIRPSYRGRGLGNLLMALTIQEARKKGIAQVHVHCLKGNIASSRVITRNGGALDSESEYGTSGQVVQRYYVAA